MSFVNEFNQLPIADLAKESLTMGPRQVDQALRKPQPSLKDFAALISPGGAERLESLARRSQRLTQKRFGKVMRLFAPLYLSNECVNNCKYCGFSRDNPILRVTLDVDEVVQEARALMAQGFRSLLLVAGEHPKFVSNGYLADCVQALHREVPSLSLEVGPMETEDYLPISRAGAEGIVVYQETYDREVYSQVHTSGPKRHFDWRLETPERAYAGGFRRLGIGALYGLSDWRFEAISVAAHAAYLLKHCWQAQVTISLPRLRPHAGEFEPLTEISDRELVQLVCAFRLFLPDVGLVLSTRESPKLRDGIMPLGITLMSAGSHTEPGGYTGAGNSKVHRTKRGRVEQPGPNDGNSTTPQGRTTNATEQFNIADERSPEEIANRLLAIGYEPVWKDWDAALTESQR